MRWVVPLRPVLVGEANPYFATHGDDLMALYPMPVGSAGWRLCHKVLGLSSHDYLRRFKRVNLCQGRWSLPAARDHARSLVASGRPLVLLGAKVAGAFGHRFEPFTSPVPGVYLLPHPSGLSRAWNALGAFARARALLSPILENDAPSQDTP